MTSAALWDGSIAQCLHQNHLIKVRFSPIEISSYALLWLLSERGRRYITLVASSTSGLHTLSISKVSALPIPIAPQKEQEQIIERVNTLLKSLGKMRHQFWELELHSQQLDQSILAKAFRGELVPQDPNDEPAAVLLDRIRAERNTLTSQKKGRPSKVKKG
jgi:type I restriction enzyme, S subunit